MATESPISSRCSSPIYRAAEDEENESHLKSKSSRNRHYSRSRSRSSSYADHRRHRVSIKQNNTRRLSRSPIRQDRRRRPSPRERKRRSRRSPSFSPPRRLPTHYRRSRSRSRTPYSSRSSGRRTGSDPPPNRCVAAFGLSMHTRERELRDIFSHYGPLDDVQVVYDKQSGRSRGFAFIYFRNVEDAVFARNKMTGQEVDGRQIRVDFSTTERAHSPTPGIYMGRVSAAERDRYRRGDPAGFRGDRSPRRRPHRSRSPYSRSRSISPTHRRRDY